MAQNIPIIRDIQFSLKNGEFVWQGQPLDLFSQTFTAYHLIKQRNPQVVREWLISLIDAEQFGSGYFPAVCGLWILGEYLNGNTDSGLVWKAEKAIDTAVGLIESQWQQPRSNWFYQTEPGIYTTNLAMAFGALQAINLVCPAEKTAQVSLAIKNFLYKELLFQGHVRSRAGDETITADIGLIAIPFAYLDAGNQILVGSVKYVEQDLIVRGAHFRKGDQYYGGCASHVLTSLLAWYYAERGEIERARGLLGQVQSAWDRLGYLPLLDADTAWVPSLLAYWREQDATPFEPNSLAMILCAIAEKAIADKQTGLQTSAAIQLIHQPTGSANPYRLDRFERFPRHPADQDEVHVFLQTQPCRPEQNVNVEISVDGQPRPNRKMLLATQENGEKYWQVSLGSFHADENVEYRFIVEDGAEKVASASYSFAVRRWLPLYPTSRQSNAQTIQLCYTNPDFTDKQVRLDLNRVNQNTWRWSYVVEPMTQPVAENAATSANQIEPDWPDLSISPDSKVMSLADAAGKPIFRTYNERQEAFAEILMEGETPCAIKIKFALQGEEQFFGLGERYSTTHYRGMNVDQFVFNQYRDQGMKTYIPVPLGISSKGYGIFLDTAMVSTFRIGTGLADLLEIEASLDPSAATLDSYIFLGQPADILRAYATLKGGPVLPPKWAFGHWISSNNWDRQSEVMRQLELGEKHQIPASVLVLEQWSDEATFYIFNDAKYEVNYGHSAHNLNDFKFPAWGRWPDPKKMVEDIHAAGLKLLLWQAPVLKYMDGIPHAQRDIDEQVMIESGYAVRRQNGDVYRVPSFEWFKNSVVPDFTNPEARDWWLSKRGYLVEEIGIDGFKTDGGECIFGEDTVFANGLSGMAMHNRYPVDYIGSYYDYLQKTVPGGGITFSRAGYAGIQKFPLVWAGDERSTYAAFRASIRAGLNCGLSGIPFWGWDLGGFNGDIPTAELYIRAAQMAAFCPVMQYHAETKGQFNQDRTPWNIAERTGHPEVIDLYRTFVNWRMNLLPYIYWQAMRSSQTGLPMMRAMVLAYPNDPSCQLLDDQYLFGENLLIAPLVYEHESSRQVYLPNGVWHNLFTGERLAGGRRLTCSADWGSLPVFIRDGSLIPLNLDDTLAFGSPVGNALDRYKQLTFLIVSENDLSEEFTDDLGNQIEFDLKISDRHIEMILCSEMEHSINLLIPVDRPISKVSLDGQPLQRFDTNQQLTAESSSGYALQNGQLAIRLPAGPVPVKVGIDG